MPQMAPVGRSVNAIGAFTVTVSTMVSGLLSKSPAQVTVTVNGSSSSAGSGTSWPTISLVIVSVPVSRVLVNAATAGASVMVVMSMVELATDQPVGMSVSVTLHSVPGGSSGSPSVCVQVPEPPVVAIKAEPVAEVGSAQLQVNVKVASAITPRGALVVFVIANVLVALSMVSVASAVSSTFEPAG